MEKIGGKRREMGEGPRPSGHGNMWLVNLVTAVFMLRLHCLTRLNLEAGHCLLIHCYRHVIGFDSEKSSQSGRVILSQHSSIAFAARCKDAVDSRSFEPTPLSLYYSNSHLLSRFLPHLLNNPSDFTCLPRGGYMDLIKMPHSIPVPPSGFQALILCGPGASLNTFTTNPEEYPKCLIPVGNRVMLYFPMTYALRAGITGKLQFWAVVL